MKEIVSIKGNQHGLSIELNNTVDFETLIHNFQSKLEAGRKFFGNNKVTISFLNRRLAPKDEATLIDLIHQVTDLEVICIVDESGKYSEVKDSIYSKIKEEIKQELTTDITAKMKAEHDENINELNQQLKTIKKELESKNDTRSNLEALLPEDCAIFHPQTLRSGQQVNTKNSVVIFGDVNNGSRIEAGGSVIVLGKLKGVVHAGLKRSKSIIIALDMTPVQLRIGDAYGRSEGNDSKLGSNYEPMVAYAKDDRIVIEPIDNKIYRELKSLKKI